MGSNESDATFIKKTHKNANSIKPVRGEAPLVRNKLTNTRSEKFQLTEVK